MNEVGDLSVKFLGKLLGWALSLALLVSITIPVLGIISFDWTTDGNPFSSQSYNIERTIWLIGLALVTLGFFLGAVAVNPIAKASWFGLRRWMRWFVPALLAICGIAATLYSFYLGLTWPQSERLERFQQIASPIDPPNANVRNLYRGRAYLVVNIELCGGDATPVHNQIMESIKISPEPDLAQSYYAAALISGEESARFNLQSGSSPKDLVCKKTSEILDDWNASDTLDEKLNAVRRL